MGLLSHVLFNKEVWVFSLLLSLTSEGSEANYRVTSKAAAEAAAAAAPPPPQP